MDKNAQSTRKRNAEARRAQAAERERDKALVLDALRAVLQDPEATAEQRIFAVVVLDRMKLHGFVPCGLNHQDIAAAFARELEREE